MLPIRRTFHIMCKSPLQTPSLILFSTHDILMCWLWISHKAPSISAPSQLYARLLSKILVLDFCSAKKMKLHWGRDCI